MESLGNILEVSLYSNLSATGMGINLHAIFPRPRETNLVKHCEGTRLSTLVAQRYLARMTYIELQRCEKSPLPSIDSLAYC